MKTAMFALLAGVIWSSAVVADVSMPVPGAENAAGVKVLTFIGQEPPGRRCNGNVQVAAEIANTYRVPIQLLPASMAPGLPAPAVFYGNQLIAADGADHNGAASYQMVEDVLELEGVGKLDGSGLLFNERVRSDFEALKATIKAGGQ